VSDAAALAAVVPPAGPLVDGLVAALDVETARLELADLDDSASLPGGAQPAPGGLVWLHAVPAGAADADGLDEAALLLRSAAKARAVTGSAGVSLTFIALVPSRGLFAGPRGRACDLARGAFRSLIENEIGAWSERGDRLLGVVYAALEGGAEAGLRPDGDVLARTPMHRAGSITELADVVRYLGSSGAAYVTGTEIHVDGGWNAYSWIHPARTI
jgi:hypothetical protein